MDLMVIGFLLIISVDYSVSTNSYGGLWQTARLKRSNGHSKAYPREESENFSIQDGNDTTYKDMLAGRKNKFDGPYGLQPTSIQQESDESENIIFRNIPLLNGIRKVDSGLSPMSKPAAGDASNEKGSGIATWVFITIGATIVSVMFSLFLLSYVYKRKNGSARTNTSTDRQFEALALDDLGDNCHVAMLSSSDRPHCYEVVGYEDENTFERSKEYDAPTPYSREGVSGKEYDGLDIQLHIPRPQFLKKPISVECEQEQTAPLNSDSNSRSKNNGNRLCGGNMDLHRQYEKNPIVNPVHEVARKSQQTLNSQRPGLQSPMDRPRTSPNSEGGSCSRSSIASHQSARSYISIPPTSPSTNYIEAWSDCLSPRSDRRPSSPIKMEWLTKNIKTDCKNELSTYQKSTAVQTDTNITSPKVKTVLGSSWQFGGAFTNQGGVLQARDSDVVLSVPAGAVSKGQTIDIYGSIFTDTASIRKKLDFPKDENLVTPVVEYLTLPGKNFIRPVYLHLPHALPDGCDVSTIKVYTFTVDDLGDVTIDCLPYEKQGNSLDEEAYWKQGSDRSKIIISTSHFSGYFCTLCKSTSLPSICTMVFGSHVEIDRRREIRVILYIWDRRLAIKDYLERFCKQEKDVDRQLLTDMQVPLLNNASGDSRLVMRMEVLGSEEDTQCWRHVARPGGARMLFKPLQVRRLSEIVQCCRQTDPLRVEWALENCPGVCPGPTFQCCIDIMHASESVCDYEAALSDDLDDLMRTFYVRDLQVTSRGETETYQEQKCDKTNLRRTLSDNLDLQQTEKICLELGFASKDIGNFHKKFSTNSEVQEELVKECLRRLGTEKLYAQLPGVLDKLQLSQVLRALQGSVATYTSKDCLQPEPVKSPVNDLNVVDDTSITNRKSVENREMDALPGLNYKKENNTKAWNNNINLSSPKYYQSSQSSNVFPKKCVSAACYKPGDSNQDLCSQGTTHGILHSSNNNLIDQRRTSSNTDMQNDRSDNNVINNRLSSSSGYESQHYVHEEQSHISLSSDPSTSLNLAQNPSPSLDKFSVTAHPGTLENQLASSYDVSSREQCMAYPEIVEELCVSTSGPSAFPDQGLQDNRNVTGYADHRDQTSKKELYSIQTIV